MTEKKPPTEKEIALERALLRARTVYKKIAEIEKHERVFREGYAHWHRLAEDAHINARGSESYLTGRADSWQELLQLITNAKHDGKEED